MPGSGETTKDDAEIAPALMEHIFEKERWKINK